ncbi:MAG TPA: porphobilinogen synthase [Anaerolineales bacterium]|nr:porphobilinogen synthase [Anaerolineales bacterium]
MPFPTTRLRRLRHTPALRALVRETEIAPSDLIAPLFVRHGHSLRIPIQSMPGVFQLSIDQAVLAAQGLFQAGISAVLLFGIPQIKDEMGSENFDPQGIVPQAIRAIKAAVPQLLVASDICLCEYNDSGHCGLLNTTEHTHLPQHYVLNDETLPILAKTAIAHAQAGADLLAPSGMIDGMVQALRDGLDSAGFAHLPILSYSVKFSSSFYGPFREAAEGAPRFGDRKTHQLDPANGNLAVREAEEDVLEGADLLMVKPALAYLDVIQRLKARFAGVPLVAYNVSGEYAMVKAAAQNGWLDEKAVVMEILLGMKRAGADLIISYHAADFARWMHEK